MAVTAKEVELAYQRGYAQGAQDLFESFKDDLAGAKPLFHQNLD